MKYITATFLGIILILAPSCAHQKAEEDATKETTELKKKPVPAEAEQTPSPAATSTDTGPSEADELTPPPSGIRDPDDLIDLMD